MRALGRHPKPCPCDECRAVAVIPLTAGGPGSELVELLNELGLHATEKCNCATRAGEMDKWGVLGCRERREEIVAWLAAEYDATSWPQVAAAGWRSLAAGLVPTIPAIVDEAIRRAEAKARAAVRRGDGAHFPAANRREPGK